MQSKWKMIAASLVAAGVATTVAAKEYRSSDVHPEDYPTVMAVKYMSDIIKQKTGGKDTIKVYTMSQLGSEKDTIEQTEDRRARLRPDQRGADEQHLPRDDGADDAVPVPVEGAHAQGARRPDRRPDPQGLRGAGLHRPRVLRFAARARCTRSRSRSSRSPT